MNILEEITRSKREELTVRKGMVTHAELAGSRYFRQPARSLIRSLVHNPQFGIIAEIKKGSPTKGRFMQVCDPAEIAKMYEDAGAAAISVLTDEKYFYGSLRDLESVRAHTSLPLLRKDFIIDEFQIFEAKASGADAVLLIAGILDKHQLSDLHSAAQELGLEALIELYESREIDNINFDRMKLIGINNRDLKTFTTDIQRTIQIASLLPGDIHVVSESGISTVGDLKILRKAGIRSALIGETFMTSGHPGETLRMMLDGFIHADKS